jgi:predicted dehydrogenase
MSFAHMHAGSYAQAVNDLPGAELAGIADHDPERAAAMAAQFSAKEYPSYEALLATDIDAVIVTSENCMHRELTQLAARAGKHVLCEKPISTTVEDAQAMIDVCREDNVQLMTAFPCRYAVPSVQMKGQVDAGCVGDILAIKGMNRGRMPGGWFVELEKSGGGAVIDHTVHVVDLMRWVMGSEAVQVYAEISNQINHGDYDDCGMLTMDFQNGVYATLDTSWSRPKSFPTWGDVVMEIVGTRGMLSMSIFGKCIAHYSDKAMAVSWENCGGNMDYAMIEDFAKSIAEGSPVNVTGEDGLKALEVALAAYRSQAAGKPVRL